MREEDVWPPGERDVGGDRASSDDPGRASRPSQEPERRERHLARTLEDVSHLFLSTEGAGDGAVDPLANSSVGQVGKENERLRRALADLTLEHLIGKEDSKRVKELERENELLRRAVTDLTLDNLLLKEAARGHT